MPKPIKQFATATTTLIIPPYEVIETATSSSNAKSTSNKSAAVIAANLSLKAAIVKMALLTNGDTLKNTQSTIDTTSQRKRCPACTSYKVTGSPQAIWTGISISGSNVIACVTDYSNAASNLIYYSSDGGKTWTSSNAPQLPWSCVSISGSYALASNLSTTDDALYYSLDTGQTWTSNGVANPITSVALDGTNAIKSVSTKKQMYYSNNVNVQPITWSNSASTISYYPTCVSISGKNAVLCGGYGSIYYSSDSGVTWNLSNSPARNWLSISISGSNAVASDQTSLNTYYSADSGASWTASNTIASSCTCVSISGVYAVAGGNGSNIYYSSDSGKNWTVSTTPVTGPWWRISMDGANAVACVYGGYIYYSTDHGASWTLS